MLSVYTMITSYPAPGSLAGHRLLYTVTIANSNVYILL